MLLGDQENLQMLPTEPIRPITSTNHQIENTPDQLPSNTSTYGKFRFMALGALRK